MAPCLSGSCSAWSFRPHYPYNTQLLHCIFADARKLVASIGPNLRVQGEIMSTRFIWRGQKETPVESKGMTKYYFRLSPDIDPNLIRMYPGASWLMSKSFHKNIRLLQLHLASLNFL